MSFVAAIGRGPRGLEPRPSSLDRRPARDYVALMAAEALPYGLEVAGGERLRFSGAEVLIKASARRRAAPSRSSRRSARSTHRATCTSARTSCSSCSRASTSSRSATRSSASVPEGLRRPAWHTPRPATRRPAHGTDAHHVLTRGRRGLLSRARRGRERRDDQSRRLRARLGALRRHLVVAARHTRGAAAPQASASAASRALRKRSFSARVP
jgi:hypothetical protein